MSVNILLMRLKNLNQLNLYGLTPYKISQNSGLSLPGVLNYLDAGSGVKRKHPSLPHIAKLLAGMELDWREIKLGSLLEDQDE